MNKVTDDKHKFITPSGSGKSKHGYCFSKPNGKPTTLPKSVRKSQEERRKVLRLLSERQTNLLQSTLTLKK